MLKWRVTLIARSAIWDNCKWLSSMITHKKKKAKLKPKGKASKGMGTHLLLHGCISLSRQTWMANRWVYIRPYTPSLRL